MRVFKRKNFVSLKFFYGKGFKNLSFGGFTLVELLIVIALVIILGSIGFVSLVEKNQRDEFNLTVKRIVTLLDQARNRSVTQDALSGSDSGEYWGVVFFRGVSDDPLNPGTDLCAGSEPSGFTPATPGFSLTRSGLTTDQYFAMPATVSFDTAVTFPGGAADCLATISFYQITGAWIETSDNSVKVFLTRDSNVSSTISVTTQGLVEYTVEEE